MSSHFFILTTQLNGNLGGCQFGLTEDGQPGYKKAGADTVYPFSSRNYYPIKFQNIDVNTDRSQANGFISETVRLVFSFSSTNTGHRTNGVCTIIDQTDNSKIYYKTGKITDETLDLDPTHSYKINIWTGGGTGYNCTFDGIGYWS